MSSWVKLSRKLATSAIAAKPEYLAVWVHLLMAASYKEGEILVGRQIVRLLPGQLVFGRHKFSEKTGVSESIVRSALKVLESLQQITIKSESKFSVITITKWSHYQDSSPADDQQMTSKRPADDHNKEVLEIQEVNQKTKRSRASAQKEVIDAEALVELGVDQQVALDWLKVRKTKKAALTVTAFNGLCREAKLAGYTIPDAVRTCAERSWVSFKAEYVNKGAPNGQVANISGSNSAVGRVTAKAAERERARQGAAPQYFEQGDFIEGEFSTG
jgi:hypothetical protein